MAQRSYQRCCPLERLAFERFCISKKKYPEIRIINEKIEPIIDRPVPLNNCCSDLTNPSLNPVTESRIDCVLLVVEDEAESIAEIEKPNITRHNKVMNDTIEAIKYFCCFGTVERLTIFFINLSVKSELSSSSFNPD